MQLPQSICWFGEETNHLKWKYLIWEARKGNNPELLLDRFYPAWQTVQLQSSSLHALAHRQEKLISKPVQLSPEYGTKLYYKPSCSRLCPQTLYFVFPLRGH